MFVTFFFLSIITIYIDWQIDGFDFFKLQKYELFFQSWVALSGVIFSLIVSVTSFFIYKNTRLPSLQFIPLSFLLIAFSYIIIGYHASYCKVCSDLTLCAASHTYPTYLYIAAFIVFFIVTIISHKLLDTEKKIKFLQQFSYGLISASFLMLIIMFFSIDYMETPDVLFYFKDTNLQAMVFMFPVIIIVFSLLYFRTHYKQVSWEYYLIASLSILSFIPQILHLYTCKECHSMECSEFYVFSGLIMFIVTGLFLKTLAIQLRESKNI